MKKQTASCVPYLRKNMSLNPTEVQYFVLLTSGHPIYGLSDCLQIRLKCCFSCEENRQKIFKFNFQIEKKKKNELLIIGDHSQMKKRGIKIIFFNVWNCAIYKFQILFFQNCK